MRWFKHLTAARRDEKLARLFHRSGNSGYGVYFRLLEIVGGEMDNSSQRCSLQYPVSTWAAELKVVLPQNVRKQLAVLEEVGLITLTADGLEIEIRIPNLLKYRDEYSRKAEQSARAQQGRSKGTAGGTAGPQQASSKGTAGPQQASSKGTAGSQQLGSGWTADEQSSPNSLTYKDEASEKSGQAQDIVRSKIERQSQKERQSTDRELDSQPADERAPRDYDGLPVQEEQRPLASLPEASLATFPDQAPERTYSDGERAATHLFQLLGTPSLNNS
jgi:hypothetical protein